MIERADDTQAALLLKILFGGGPVGHRNPAHPAFSLPDAPSRRPWSGVSAHPGGSSRAHAPRPRPSMGAPTRGNGSSRGVVPRIVRMPKMCKPLRDRCHWNPMTSGACAGNTRRAMLLPAFADAPHHRMVPGVVALRIAVGSSSAFGSRGSLRMGFPGHPSVTPQAVELGTNHRFTKH